MPLTGLQGNLNVNLYAWNAGTLQWEAYTGTGGGGGGAVTIADAADVAQGATTDAAVTSDTTGTLSGKLRGLVKMLADMWDSANHWLKVSVQNTVNASVTGTVGISGNVTVTQGTGANLHTVVDSGSVTVNTISNYAQETGGNLATIATDVARIPAQGAALTAASMPVNIASDQTVPVSVSGVPHVIVDSNSADPDPATASLQNVHTALLQQVAQALLACDTTNVTISGGAISISGTPSVQVLNALSVSQLAVGAQNLPKQEDMPAADTDVGVAALAVRDSNLLVQQTDEQDYAWHKVDRQGRLWVRSDLLEQKMDEQRAALGLLLTQMSAIAAQMGAQTVQYQ